MNILEAYGAGVPSLAKSSGLPADTIAKAIEARKKKYPLLYKFDEDVEDEVKRTRALTTLRTDAGYQRAVGYYTGPTKTILHFLENQALPWQQAKGIMTNFSPTQIKNYPSQSLGGEVMQTMMGKVFRVLVHEDLRTVVKMILTVHDSLYFDFKTETLAKKYLPMIAGVLEDVCSYFNYCFEDCNWDTPFPIDVDYGKNIKDVGRKPHEVLEPGEVRDSVHDRDNTW